MRMVLLMDDFVWSITICMSRMAEIKINRTKYISAYSSPIISYLYCFSMDLENIKLTARFKIHFLKKYRWMDEKVGKSILIVNIVQRNLK